MAIHRENSDGKADLIDKLRGVEGVRIVAASGRRARIEVDDTAVLSLRNALGSGYRVEPAVPHHPA